MVESNATIDSWTVSLLQVKVNGKVLGIGFGPGVTIQELAEHAPGQRLSQQAITSRVYQ